MSKFFHYFGFSSVERRGFMLLTVLIVVVQLLYVIYSRFNSKPTITHHALVLEDTYKEHVNQRNTKHYTGNFGSNNIRENIKYFHFDPNKLDKEGWLSLGLSDRQAAVILNYVSKGGKFYKAEDLKKIYSITEHDYERLLPYITITSNRKELNVRESFSNESVHKKEVLVQLNDADTTALKQLKGIGSVLSARIIKYRDALGGFVHKEQMREVYGLSEETYESIADKIIVVENDIKKININTVSKDELSKHPYISKKLAQTIVNYRTQHGDFKNLESLAMIKSIDKNFLLKIAPYLEF